MELETDYYSLGGAGVEHLRDIGGYLEETAVERQLLELVKIRASQRNQCAHCLVKHIDAAREAGVDEQRLQTVATWEESSSFTRRERAALAWTDALTRLTDGIPPEAREVVGEEFTDQELVTLRCASG